MRRREGSGPLLRTAVTIATSSLIALGAFGIRVSQASCAAPWIETDGSLEGPIEVRPGDTIEVVGEAWSLDCNDSCGTSVFSCTGCDPPPQRPISDISITLQPRAGSTSWVLADEIDANDDLGFRVSVTLPRTLREGRYELVGSAGGGGGTQPIELVIR